MSIQSVFGLQSLPKELHLEVAKRLSLVDLFNFRLVSRQERNYIDMIWMKTRIGPEWPSLSALFRKGNNLYNCREVRSIYDDDQELAIRINFRTLTLLDVSHNLRITGKIVRAITLYCPHLSSINLNGCSQLQYEDVQYLLMNCTITLETVVPPYHLLNSLADQRFVVFEERERDRKGAIIRGVTYLIRRSWS